MTLTTQLNVIDNPLFEKYEQLSNDSSQTADDEQHLVEAADVGDPATGFATVYAKCWPMRMLSAINWVLLLALFISCAVGNSVSLSRAGYYRSAPIGSAQFCAIIGVLLLLATLVKLFYWRANKNTDKSNVALAGIMDLCFTLFTIPAFVLMAFNYSLVAFNEWSHFYPKLHGPLAELTNYQEQKPNWERRGRWDWDYDEMVRRVSTTTESPIPTTTTFSPDALEEMSYRRRQILLHLLLHPAIILLAVVALVVSVVRAVSLRRAVKRTNLWLSNYAEQFPQCTQMEAKYAQWRPHGLLKTLQWIVPMLMFVIAAFTSYEVAYSRDMPQYGIALFIATLVAFFRWLGYIQAVHLRTNSEAKCLRGCLARDLLLALVGACFFGFLGLTSRHNEMELLKFLNYSGLAVFVASAYFSLKLAVSSGGGWTGPVFNLPRISIQVTVVNGQEQQQKEKEGIESGDTNAQKQLNLHV